MGNKFYEPYAATYETDDNHPEGLIGDEYGCPGLIGRSKKAIDDINLCLLFFLLCAFTLLFFFNPIANELTLGLVVFGAVSFGALGILGFIKAIFVCNQLRAYWGMEEDHSFRDYLYFYGKCILALLFGLTFLGFSLSVAGNYLFLTIGTATPEWLLVLNSLYVFVPYVFIGFFSLQVIAAFLEFAKAQYIKFYQKVTYGIFAVLMNTSVVLFLLATLGILSLGIPGGNIALFSLAIFFTAIVFVHRVKAHFKEVYPLHGDVDCYLNDDKDANAAQDSKPTHSANEKVETSVSSTPTGASITRSDEENSDNRLPSGSVSQVFGATLPLANTLFGDASQVAAAVPSPCRCDAYVGHGLFAVGGTQASSEQEAKNTLDTKAVITKS